MTPGTWPSGYAVRANFFLFNGVRERLEAALTESAIFFGIALRIVPFPVLRCIFFGIRIDLSKRVSDSELNPNLQTAMLVPIPWGACQIVMTGNRKPPLSQGQDLYRRELHQIGIGRRCTTAQASDLVGMHCAMDRSQCDTHQRRPTTSSL